MHDKHPLWPSQRRLLYCARQMLAERKIYQCAKPVADPKAAAKQICEAALSLFLEKGFAATTIRDICSLSGVNQARHHDYIANKNDHPAPAAEPGVGFREDVCRPCRLSCWISRPVTRRRVRGNIPRNAGSMKRGRPLLGLSLGHIEGGRSPCPAAPIEFAGDEDLAGVSFGPRLGLQGGRFNA